MAAALYDPTAGYYNRSDLTRWGRTGDYRTSPECTYLFGATFARFFAKIFQQLGEPKTWTIVESGAGNGEFAGAVLEKLKADYPFVFEATRYIVDDVSEDSRRRAEVRLKSVADKVQYKRLNEITAINPGIFFSNELVDAFPVHLLTVSNSHLRELYVRLTSAHQFEFVDGPLSTSKLDEFVRENPLVLKEGQVVEINLQLFDWLVEIENKLTTGFVITVEYGAEEEELYGAPERFKGTLRAFHQHRFVENVLSAPGMYDITSTINWTQLRKFGEQLGFETASFSNLDQFLLNEGLLEEVQRVFTTEQSQVEKLRTTTQAREMVLPGGMASHFQVLVQRKSLRS